MAAIDAQMIPGALLFGAAKGRAGVYVEIKRQAAPVPWVPEIPLPEYWNSFPEPGGGYVGPLMGQMFIAVGYGAHFDGDVLRIGGAVLIGSAGKVFAFSSIGSADMWVAINKARALREVELQAGMAPEKRAVWAAAKREKLAKYSARVLAAAAKVSDVQRQAALIAESEFAAAKWAA